jgi:hypothetical protein
MLRFSRVVCLLILLHQSLIVPGTTFACQGIPGAESFLLNLESYSTVIAGRILTVSNDRINAILEVDQILKGEVSSNRIVLMRNSIADIESYRAGRGLARPCQSMKQDLPTGVRFIASLYRGQSGYYDGVIIPENADGLFTLQPSPETQISRSYEETISYLSEILQRMPNASQPGPSPRPVIIHLFTTTEEYMVPLDNLEPIPSIQEILCVIPISTIGLLSNCTTSFYAPNQIDYVSLFSEGVTTTAFTVEYPFRYSVAGDSAAFSTNSDLLAVWRGQELRIYATLMQFQFAKHSYRDLNLLVTQSLAADEPLIPGAGAWHPNGRIFAFSSQSGIWFWDALQTDSQPALFMAAEQYPLLVRHFSLAGNYLVVEANSERYHIDIHSLHEYPDGEFSPNDHLLAAYDTQAVNLTELQIYRVLPNFEPLLTFQQPDPEIWDAFTVVPYTYDISEFEWISNNDLLLTACGTGYPPSIHDPDFEGDWCKVGRITFGVGSQWIDGFQFDYDPITESLITLLDGNKVNLNGEILDFSHSIREPIIRVQIEPVIHLHYQNFD